MADYHARRRARTVLALRQAGTKEVVRGILGPNDRLGRLDLTVLVNGVGLGRVDRGPAFNEA